MAYSDLSPVRGKHSPLFPAIISSVNNKDHASTPKMGRWSAMYEAKLHRLADERRMHRETFTKEAEQSRAEVDKAPLKLQTLVRDHMRRIQDLKTKVSPLSEYQQHRPHQILCHYCVKPCLSDSVPCRSCSSVAHRLCLSTDFIDKKVFNCPECVSAYQLDIEHNKDSMAHLEENMRVQYYTERLGQRLVTFMKRTLYKRKRMCAIKVQSITRLVLARKQYLKSQGQQMRAVVIEVLEIPKLNLHTGLVILSIFDASSKEQISRAEKSPIDALREVTVYSMIVLTFCSMDAVHSQQYNIVGQVVMSLRDHPQYKNNDIEFHIDISTRINWIPTDHEESSEMKYKLNLPLTTETILRETSCWLRLRALRNVMTLCGGFNGPSLMHFHKAGDKVILREKEKQAALKTLTTQAEMKSARRYWLCFFDHHCYVYREATDLNPRFVMNLKNADVEVSRALLTAVCIVFGDNRTFIFEFDSSCDTSRFMFIYNEGKLALTGHSKYPKTLKDKRPFGHISHLI